VAEQLFSRILQGSMAEDMRQGFIPSSSQFV